MMQLTQETDIRKQTRRELLLVQAALSNGQVQTSSNSDLQIPMKRTTSLQVVQQNKLNLCNSNKMLEEVE